MREFLDELREHWDDSYWWADHQLLMAVLLGLVGLAFTAAELWLRRRWQITDA